MTIEENSDIAKTGEQLQKALSDKTKREIEYIKSTNAHDMLEKVAKDLKLTGYNLSRCVTSGTDHFIKLTITTLGEIKEYREYL